MDKGLTVLKDLLIGDRAFEVPVYQRNYSWEKKQCEDLWNDIYYLKPGKKHYFGTILLKNTDKIKEQSLKSFEVLELIDGQQRISTILMLLREIISQIGTLDDPEFKIGVEKLEEDYLKYGHVYKLDLMGEDKEFYRDYVINNKEFPADIVTPSRKRLKEAKSFFKEKFESIKEEKDPTEFKEFLLEQKRKIDDMDIIRYEVENDADAVLIFETVNDRGKTLTNLEKTKSFLMHAVYLSDSENLEESLEIINNSFSEIFRWFESIKTSKNGKFIREDDVQRYHFIIYEELTKRREMSYKYINVLKEKIKNNYRTDEKMSLKYVLEYTEDLKSTFFALKEIVNYDETDAIGTLIHKIFTLERVANFYPLLISVWINYKKEVFNEEEVIRILNLIEVASFRIYAIGKRRSNSGEGLLYTLAYDIHKNNWNFDQVERKLIELIKVYEDDKSFKIGLKSENFYNKISKSDIKYLLYEYEKSLMEEPIEITLESILVPDFQIEHICPNNPSKLNLSPEEKVAHEQYKDKLGNLTIVLREWNIKWGNKPFDKKKKDYRKSMLKIQNMLPNFDNWGENEIKNRENQIIKYALKRWQLPTP